MERLSKGLRGHLRKELSAARKSGDQKQIHAAENKTNLLRKPARETVSKSSRLQKDLDAIEQRLIGIGPLSLEEQAELKYKQIWLKFATNQIDKNQRLNELRALEQDLEENNIAGLDHLNAAVTIHPETGLETTRREIIRDEILNS